MTQADGALYTAFMARDSRFDGRFFVGISSTGIYCRPVCPARRAKRANCAFFPSAAAAEQAGYRPCLLCRPELAPGLPPPDAPQALAHRAAALMEEACGSGEGLAQLAARLGYTQRHLRRLFLQEYGVSPVQYLQTCRLLLAKGLLTDTRLSVLEVAMAAGFGSLRRMNDLFKRHYRMPPTALRKLASGKTPQEQGLVVSLAYRPPYPFAQVLGFLAGRAIAGIEQVEQGQYLRTVRLRGREGTLHTGWARVSQANGQAALRVELSQSLTPVLPQALSRLKRLFDLACDPDAIVQALAGMGSLLSGLPLPGIRLPGCFEPFETAARAILGQQVTVKAAGTLAGRLVRAFGAPVDTGIPGLSHAFPEPEDILALGEKAVDRLGQLGIIGSRSGSICSLARAMVAGDLRLDPGADPEEAMAVLQRIRGIGPWTAQYIAMRTLGYPDAFLETDAGVRQALPGLNGKELLALAEAWRPFRSYAVMNLWNSL